MKTLFTKISVLIFFITGMSQCHNSFAQTTGTITDADGNNYQTIKIGSQTWMLENLRTTKYNDGTPIATHSETTEKNNVPAYAVHQQEGYGNLYNWYAVNTQRLAPKGWRVPSKQDWDILINYLGGQSKAGEKLKNGNWDAHKQIQFNVLFAGYIGYNGRFLKVDDNAYWYSCTEGRGGKTGDSYRVYKTTNNMHWGSFDKKFFMSVRCIKN